MSFMPKFTSICLSAAVFMGAVMSISAQAQNIEHIGTPRLHERANLSMTIKDSADNSRQARPRSLTSQSTIAGVSRFLIPTSWSGFAQDGVDTNRPSSARLTQDEPWVKALEEWLSNEKLTARLDWNTNRFYLNAGRVAQGQGAVAAPATTTAQAPARAPAPTTQEQPPAQATAQPAPLPSQSWEIDLKDIHLGNTFARWGKKLGWSVLWDAPKHIMIEATNIFTGSLPEAIDQVLRSPGIAAGAFPLEACIYPNTPPLVRITLKGEQSNDCK
jgi:hypothetical protein